MADTLDVITLAQAKAALRGLQGPADDVRVAGMITAVSRRLDEACGPIVARPRTETHLDGGRGMLWLTGKVFTGAGAIAPVITEAWWSETPVTVPASDYVVENDITDALRRWSAPWAARVSVVYTAGRYATTADVKEPFVTAAGMLLQHWWRPSMGGGSETYGLNPGLLATGVPSFGFPNTVRDILAGELRPPALV